MCLRGLRPVRSGPACRSDRSWTGPDRTGPAGPCRVCSKHRSGPVRTGPVHVESVQNTGPDRSGPDRSMQSLFKTPVRTGLAGPCRNDSKPSTWQQQCHTVTRFSLRLLILLDVTHWPVYHYFSELWPFSLKCSCYLKQHASINSSTFHIYKLLII